MYSRHFDHAAKLWFKRRSQGTIAEKPKLDNSQQAVLDEQVDREQLRDVVEDQFMQMNKTHDRIRDEFLGKSIT
ncbi:MAG TPA: hypothetical protein VIV66_13005 [Pyrinomonadaceae bacterium]